MVSPAAQARGIVYNAHPSTPSRSSEQDDGGNSNNYEALNLVGTGAYGAVYRARDLRDGNSFVALKRIRMKLTSEGVPLNALREIAILKKLDKYEHPNIVRLLDICLADYSQADKETTLTFVFEFMNMDLGQYIRRCPPPGLPHSRVKDFLYQMLQGIDFLHSNKIVHRDLKPQNILLTNSHQLKLADMGLARDEYGSAIDLWSVGCMFAEMLNRRPLFPGQSEITQLQKIFSIIGLPDEHDWPSTISLPRTSFPYTPQLPFDEVISELTESESKDLLEKLLRFNQYERINAQNALQHTYFDDINQCNETETSSNVPTVQK